MTRAMPTLMPGYGQQGYGPQPDAQYDASGAGYCDPYYGCPDDYYDHAGL